MARQCHALGSAASWALGSLVLLSLLCERRASGLAWGQGPATLRDLGSVRGQQWGLGARCGAGFLEMVPEHTGSTVGGATGICQNAAGQW